MYNRPQDVSRIVNKPSWINFALGINRNGHTNNRKLIFQQIIRVRGFPILLGNVMWNPLTANAAFGKFGPYLASLGCHIEQIFIKVVPKILPNNTHFIKNNVFLCTTDLRMCLELETDPLGSISP